MSRHSMDVFDGPARLGRVEYDSLDERFSFQYDESWRTAGSSYSISPHITMSVPSAQSGTVRRFLENLLPEGRALDIVAATHQISKNNVFGLIRQLGRETTGALSFHSADEIRAMLPTSRREIGQAELEQRIRERAHVPFAVWDGRVRMSIAGYQDKLAVYRDDRRLYLVEGELASTHILKPEPAEARVPWLVANEHFSMRLAARLGLATAPVSILRCPTPVLMVERFDRARSDGRLLRRHVIDGCQALDVPVSYKYERNFGAGRDVRHIRDGVSFERLFSLAEYTNRKAVTRLSLVRWALLQYLLGNTDAHGKNISFYCRREGLELAPFYDLVSIVQYEGMDDELAMAFGDEFRLDEIRAYDWAEFARRTGTPRAVLAREMRRMGTAAMSAAAQEAARPDYQESEQAFVGKIAGFVRRQADRLVSMSALTMKVELD